MPIYREVPPDNSEFHATALHVDVHHLRDLAAGLRSEIDANLEPYARRIISDHVRPPDLGVFSPSAGIQAARDAYKFCLSESVDSLSSYIGASREIVQAIELVAGRYKSVDDLAGTRAQQIAVQLDIALAAADRSRRAADLTSATADMLQAESRRDHRFEATVGYEYE